MTSYLSTKNRTVRFRRARERALEIMIASAKYLPELASGIVFGYLFVGILFGMAE